MNNSTIHNETNPAVEFRYVGIVIGIADILLGSVGNLMTIFVFSRNINLQLSFNYFVVSLATIDLITASLMMPFNVIGYVGMNWPLGGPDNITTSLQAFFYFSCGYSSVVCLILITINRLVSIQFPQYYERLFTKRRVYLAIVISWLIAPSLLFPTLLGKGNDGKPILGWMESQFLCTFVQLPDDWTAYMQFLRATFQFLPIFLMILMYLAMFCTLNNTNSNAPLPWEKDKTLATGERNNLVGMNELNLTEEEAKIAKKMKSKEKLEREKRLLRVSVTICIVFTLLFLPSVIINLLPNRNSLDPRIHMIASNITWLNSCVNPFIYAMVNPKFLIEYKILLRFLWLKLTCKL